MELVVPPAVTLGETVKLECHYHLQASSKKTILSYKKNISLTWSLSLSFQGEELYTVKLYKGRHEFLQLVPSKTPPLKTFPLKGVNVGVSIKIKGNAMRSHLKK